MGSSGSGAASRDAARARQEEEARQARIREGTSAINNTFDSQFRPEFFDARRQAYTDWATPQLQDQYGDAAKQLLYALDRGGNLDSTARAEKNSELSKLYQLRNQELTDQAVTQANKARANVEASRSDLLTTLNATGDADQAARAANSQAAIMSQQEAYSPLANLFADFTAGLGVQAAQERAQALSGGAYRARFDTGLFAPRNSVSVTGG